ncbi:hypothetical protein BD410DRAFT_335621 [Rickenella mellea]|uniref:DUF7770 domain-containing protein n=1 Tax=Rickenella mellea TaxID=50990 RepID=A0A4Y7QM23_9AGAM|nr:hypothetical protein BD410DRAFT_335621 [Rickenella mellea]
MARFLSSQLLNAAAQRNDRTPAYMREEHIRTEGIPAVAQRTVNSITVHACSTVGTSAQGSVSVAHFRLFLGLSGVRPESVELNNTGHQGGRTTTTFITYRPYSRSQTVTTLGYQVVNIAGSNLTVNQILEHLFVTKRRHLYRLDADTGSGCRFWCRTVLSDMVAQTWIPSSAIELTEAIAEAIQRNNKALVSEVGNPRGGIFY